MSAHFLMNLIRLGDGKEEDRASQVPGREKHAGSGLENSSHWLVRLCNRLQFWVGMVVEHEVK